MTIHVSLEILIFIIIIIIGVILVLRRLVMPLQYYEAQEFFEEKLRDRINITPDYFGVIKDVEPGDLADNNEKEMKNTKPEEIS